MQNSLHDTYLTSALIIQQNSGVSNLVLELLNLKKKVLLPLLLPF